MKYELVEILKKGETYISGKEMLKRAKELGIISGKKEVDYLLEHQYEIPEEWRQYYLVFPNYLRSAGGRRHVAYLLSGGKQWFLDFYWLDYSFSSRGRFVRASESSDSGKLGSSLVLELLDEIENKIKSL